MPARSSDKPAARVERRLWGSSSHSTPHSRGRTYTANAPSLKLYEISTCRGDLDNDNDVDFFDIDPLIMAFDPGATYDANFPGLSGCRVYLGDCDCDGEIDFFDFDPFVANLGHCVSDCASDRMACASLQSAVLDP